MAKYINLEKTYIEGLVNGDKKSFQILFNLYKDRIFTYCLKFTKCEILAEEIVQEVFIKIWLHRKRIKPEFSFNSFIYKITRNLALDYLRKVSADNLQKKRLQFYFEKIHNETEEAIIFSDLEKLLSTAVESLPPQRKLIYKMSRNLNLTHDEIANELSLSKHTVRNQIIEAIKFIKKYFTLNSDITFILTYIFLIF